MQPVLYEVGSSSPRRRSWAWIFLLQNAPYWFLGPCPYRITLSVQIVHKQQLVQTFQRDLGLHLMQA